MERQVCLLLVTRALLPREAAQAKHCTNLLGMRLQCPPKDIVQSEALAPFWQLKLEGPEEGGKHQEELHSSKLLSGTHPMPWKQRERSKGSRGLFLAQSCSHLTLQAPALCLLPAEKGRKASLVTKFPSLSRKWPGLNCWGVSQHSGSHSTEAKLGKMMVP